MSHINTGSQVFAASLLSFFSIIVFLIERRISAAIIHPITGDIIQDAIICPILLHSTIHTPYPVTHAPISHPITECVADTGAFTIVAMLIHRAAQSSVDIIIAIKFELSVISSGFMIHPLMVLTTSPPAIIAPEASQIAAMMMAHTIVIAFAHTAGPMLLATSFAPMLTAM